MTLHNDLRTVALIRGGEGKEHNISCLGAEYVKGLIDGTKYRVLPIYIDREGLWRSEDHGGAVAHPTLTEDGGGVRVKDKFIRIDAALPLLHGDMGEDGAVQGALRCAHIPFVGADTVTGAVACDKGYTKAVAEALGIPTACWIYYVGKDVAECRRLAEEKLGYPMFVKPARLGSSVGAYPVRTPDEFNEAFASAIHLGDGRLLVEELIQNKRELEVAYFSAGGQRIISHPAEVVCDGFYSYGRKYDSPAVTLTRAELSPKIAAELRRYCELLAKALGLRHLSRIDFFLSGERIIFNEINTMPGFTASSLYPRILGECGIPPSALINLLIGDVLGEAGV